MRSALLAATALSITVPALANPAHIVVVVEENHNYEQIIGNTTDAPYINSLANSGLSFTNSHGFTHPSQPNYLELFSGSTQGRVNDTISPVQFTTPNLAASLIASGKSFAGYSEGQPSVGYLGTYWGPGGATDQHYSRKHNPWSNWQGTGANQLDPSVNQPFTTFQGITDYNTLPTVSFVVPDQINDEHDLAPFTTPLSTLIKGSDIWLQDNIGAYATWAKTHNSLLIVTWDEGFFDATIPGYTPGNHIPTIITGQFVAPQTNGTYIDEDGLLHTITDLTGLAPLGNAAGARSFASAVPEPASIGMLGLAIAGLAGLRRRRG